MFHEDGHAIVSLITNGKVVSISLFANTEGVTYTLTSTWLSAFLTSIAGYLFSSLFVFLFAILYKKQHFKWILYIILLTIAVNLVFWVRNFYGIVWLVVFGAFLISSLRSTNKGLISFVSFLALSILFVDSLRAGFDVAIISLFHPAQAGDAANLGRITFLPSFIWGILFLFLAIWFAWISIKYTVLDKGKPF